jgi:hypothetical protein
MKNSSTIIKNRRPFGEDSGEDMGRREEDEAKTERVGRTRAERTWHAGAVRCEHEDAGDGA